MDRISRERRSWNMSKIRSKDTIPEKKVRSLLHAKGYRFRLHVASLPGKPDIVLSKYKTVIFVHGCFWHQHPGCRYAYIPKTRIQFWKKKFQQNEIAHERAVGKLTEKGWHVLVVWECELSAPDLAGHRITLFLQENSKKRGS